MNQKGNGIDSGSYVNGIYTTVNGSSGLGLHCPKGARLFDPNMKPAVYFLPEDTPPDEDFRPLTQVAAKGVVPYYVISNYGRVVNTWTNAVLKENYRSGGYGYYCLAADDTKNGQRKFSTHRMVLSTFHPVEGMENLQVNHKNLIKSDNYVDKVMEDGTVQSNLEWVTSSENIQHERRAHSLLDNEKAKEIRNLHDEGYSYDQIRKKFDGDIKYNTVKYACENKTFVDKDYDPHASKLSTRHVINKLRLSDEDAVIIRSLSEHGYKQQEIKDIFYPDFSIGTVSDIVTRKTHTNV